MTVITKSLSQQEKDEKQKNKEKHMDEISLSDDVDVEAPRRVYCYTRARKNNSTNTCIVITIMLITCVALAVLGYYQFHCLRKSDHENSRRHHLKLYQTKPSQSSHKQPEKSDLLRIKLPESHEESKISDPALTTLATSVEKYHRGTCRVPCHIQQTLQKLCPNRSPLKKEQPKEILEGKAPKEGPAVVLGGLGDWNNNKEEQPLVTNEVEIQKTRETQSQTFGDDGTFELRYELDLDQETVELIQMPEVSSGVYIHDFTVNRTAIIEETRCFVMVMDRNEIAPPRTFYDMLQNIKKDGYELNLDEVQHDMKIVLPELKQDEVFKEYGLFVGRLCSGKTVYKLSLYLKKLPLGKIWKVKWKMNLRLY